MLEGMGTRGRLKASGQEQEALPFLSVVDSKRKETTDMLERQKFSLPRRHFLGKIVLKVKIGLRYWGKEDGPSFESVPGEWTAGLGTM